MHREARLITKLYGVLLELDTKTLVAAAHKDTTKWMQLVRDNTAKHKRSENISWASDYLAETATMLVKFGRMQEAVQWSRWAEQLDDLACQVEEDEERAGRRMQKRSADGG